jgi:hypothetical protein
VDCMRGIWDGIRAQICKPFKEPMDRFPACRAGTTILSDVPARQAKKADGIDSLESISGLLKCLKIRALEFWNKQKEYVQMLYERSDKTDLNERI